MRAAVAILALAALAGCGMSRKETLPVLGAVPRFQLISQTGKPFDSVALDGGIWVADFIYTTCPGPCPRMTSQMRQVQDATRALSVKLVSFTVDPERDTPPALLEYAKLHGAAAERWYFLTGPRETLQKLAKDAFKLGDVDGKLMHSTRFVLLDRRARIRGYYDTSEGDAMERLVNDIHRLTGERS